jgi:hypothetical protein
MRVGPKGTVVHPLDGGALSRVGNALTGERTRGGAAAYLLHAAMCGAALASLLLRC